MSFIFVFFLHKTIFLRTHIPTQNAPRKAHHEPLSFSISIPSATLNTPPPSSLMDIISNGQVHLCLSLQDMDYLCLTEV